jgi:hypothetical protein
LVSSEWIEFRTLETVPRSSADRGAVAANTGLSRVILGSIDKGDEEDGDGATMVAEDEQEDEARSDEVGIDEDNEDNT